MQEPAASLPHKLTHECSPHPRVCWAQLLLTCFHASFFFALIPGHPSSSPFLGTFSLLSPPRKVLCSVERRAQHTAQRGAVGGLDQKFGKEIPSRNLREKRSVYCWAIHFVFLPGLSSPLSVIFPSCLGKALPFWRFSPCLQKIRVLPKWELIFGKGMRISTFQFSESGSSLTGPDLFIELLFL